jgi:hypothetical protein
LSAFFGAIGSQKFIDASESHKLEIAFDFHSAIQGLSVHYDASIPIYCSLTGKKKRFCSDHINLFNELRLSSNEIKKFVPYLLTTKHGTHHPILVKDLEPILGEDFTTSFHAALQAIAGGAAKNTGLHDFANTFTRFVVNLTDNDSLISAEMLLMPPYVQFFLEKFMEFHFFRILSLRTGKQEGSIGSLQKLWTRYILCWKKLADQGIVAGPEFLYPQGNPKLNSFQRVGHRRVKTDSDGNARVITKKLLTPLPLHLSDDEATLVAFRQIESDFLKVQTFLRKHLEDYFDDYELGCQMAANIPCLPSPTDLQNIFIANPTDGQRETILPFAVKFIKSTLGGYYDISKERTVLYPYKKIAGRITTTIVSRYLGVPRVHHALALMGLLASHDGSITESALMNAKLYDQNGVRINAVHTDAGIRLTLLKERDETGGWRTITLNDEASWFVRKWIEVTDPIRNYMRSHNIHGWQNLFVYSVHPLGEPICFLPGHSLMGSFRLFASKEKEFLGDLADHVSISRIRSSKGVLAFLKNMNIAEMARELGNKSETSLKHYLPECLWQYFADRWIRIFQHLLIVRATRDTPYLARSLKFKNADEMDQFLQTHALRTLSQDITDSAYRQHNSVEYNDEQKQGKTDLMVAASPGIFATLLSIMEASELVAQTGATLNAKATYWSQFTVRIKAYIESKNFHDRQIKNMLSDAALYTAPSKYLELVRA